MKKTAIFMLSLIIASSMAACESGTKSTGGNAIADGNTLGKDTIVDGKMKDEVVISIPKVVDPNVKQGAGNLPPGDSNDNNQFTRYVKEKLNISFEAAFTTAPEAYAQKLSLAMASNELPDVTVVAEPDFRKLVENGQVEDLTAVYNKYASPTLKKIYDSTNGRSLEQATVDGKLMAIPNVNTMADFTNMLWVRKDWLDKLGLKEPKTLDDIITVAKAFKEEDPDGNGQADTMGLPGPSKNSALVTNDKNHYFGFEQIFALDHAFPGMWVKNDKGEIEYGSIQPQAKKGLEALQKMYRDGVIDNQFAFRDDPSQFVKSGKAGMFFGPWWMPLGMLQDAVKNDPNAEWISILAPFGEDGTFTTNRGSASGDFVVLKKGFKHPEALVLYMNLYGANLVGEDPEGAQKLDPNVDLGYWPIRMTLEYGDKVERTSIEIQGVIDGKNKPESLDPVKKTIYEAYLRDQKNPRKVVPDWALSSSWLASGKVLSQQMKFMNNEFTGTTESMIQKWATLSKLENETYLKIVMGQLDISAFDDFAKKWTELGGEQVTKEVRKQVGK